MGVLVSVGLAAIVGAMLSSRYVWLALGIALIPVLAISFSRLDRILAQGAAVTITFSGLAAGPLTAPDLFLLPGLLLLLVQNRRSGKIPSWVLGSGAMLAISALAPAIVLNDLGDRVGLLKMSGALVLVGLVIGSAASDPSTAKRIVRLFVVSATINATFGLAQKSGVTQLFYPGELGPRVPGLSAHPNQLGLICAIGLTLALFLGRDQRFWWALATINLAGIVVSGSRTALVAGVFGVLALIVHSRLLARPNAMIQVATVACLAVVLFKFASIDLDPSSAIFRLGDMAGTASSNNERIGAATEAFQTFLDSPVFGKGAIGIGAHDLALTLLRGGGLVAMTGFAWYSIGVLRTARRHFAASEVALCGMLAFEIWLFAGLTHNGYYDRWLFLGPSLLVAYQVTGLSSGGKQDVEAPGKFLGAENP